MSIRGPRLEFAVGAFLLLGLASLLVLALASSNGKFGFGQSTYPLTARFTNLGQLRPTAPVNPGAVPIRFLDDVSHVQLKEDNEVSEELSQGIMSEQGMKAASNQTGGVVGERHKSMHAGGGHAQLKD